jgi:hypothetical protein
VSLPFEGPSVKCARFKRDELGVGVGGWTVRAHVGERRRELGIGQAVFVAQHHAIGGVDNDSSLAGKVLSRIQAARSPALTPRPRLASTDEQRAETANSQDSNYQDKPT